MGLKCTRSLLLSSVGCKMGLSRYSYNVEHAPCMSGMCTITFTDSRTLSLLA